MKRFDRAMYAFFLLALLADVARSHALVTAGGDAGGGLILSVVSQIPGGATGGAVLVPRRSDRTILQSVRGKGNGWTLSRWARTFFRETKASRSLNSSNPVLLSAVVYGPDAGGESAWVPPLEAASHSIHIFEHTGSPAP